MTTYHPPDLLGDIKGKASNYKWAVKQVEDHIRGSQGVAAGLQEEMCLIHVADADSLYDPNYFPNVTYHFCIDPNRYHYVWQPCMIPTCNFWELAAPCRQVNTMIAAQEMMAANDPLEFQIPFSTYGYALTTLQAISGTGNAADAQDGDVIAEDHHLFIKGFFALEGRLRVHPIFLPCLNFAVGGDAQGFCQNIYDRFVQAKRHMFGISEFVFLLSLIVRGGWCCRRTGFGCRGRLATVNLTWKMLKIHGIPYLGLWVLLGVVLTGLINLDVFFCKRWDAMSKSFDVCDDVMPAATKTAGWVTFTVATALTFAGTVPLVASFVRMLHATHHTLQNIANPTGSFMTPHLWQVKTEFEMEQDGPHSPHFSAGPQRRPIAVGAGFPWFGSFLQILVEFVILGFISSMLFGTIPAIMAMFLLIGRGHKMDYVTAPKPGAAPPGRNAMALTATDAISMPLTSGDAMT